jgi:hypothetical protein
MGAEPALERLRDERGQIDELFDCFARHQRDPQYQAADAQRLCDWICTLLRVHDDLETTVLHPAIGLQAELQAAYEQVAEKRAAVRLLMEVVETLSPDDPEHRAQMGQLAAQARQWFDTDERLFELTQGLPSDLSLLDMQLGRRQEALLSAETSAQASALH